MTRRRLGLLALWAVVALELAVIVSSAWTLSAGAGRVVSVAEAHDGPPTTVIVLGAKSADGEPGTYLRNRLEVAVELYRSGRADRVLISGNDSEAAGNEVQVMRSYLEARGIPAGTIVDDRAGLNTAATCRRAADEFGVRRALIVTQGFHIGRAVGLCRDAGIDVIGVVAPCDGCTLISRARNYVREPLLARPRAALTVLTTSR